MAWGAGIKVALKLAAALFLAQEAVEVVEPFLDRDGKPTPQPGTVDSAARERLARLEGLYEDIDEAFEDDGDLQLQSAEPRRLSPEESFEEAETALDDLIAATAFDPRVERWGPCPRRC